MKRAFTWLVSLAVASATFGTGSSPVAAYDAHVWSNSDAFTVTCIGVRDTYPALSYTLAAKQYARLGYSPVGGALGPSFTRSAVLGSVGGDFAFYVHSHGDNYWAASGAPRVDSGFLQDPGAGKCNTTRDIIRASSIHAVAVEPYRLVIMSTCMLGSSGSTMPAAFYIEKVKNSTQFEFYLGFVGHTWDSASYRFESLFWSFMNKGPAGTMWLSAAFTYATSIGGYEPVGSEAFRANWWGNPMADGTPTQRSSGCVECA